MKVTMMVAFVLALPYVLYQVWAFIAPGLYEHEKTRSAHYFEQLFALFIGHGLRLFLCFPRSV